MKCWLESIAIKGDAMSSSYLVHGVLRVACLALLLVAAAIACEDEHPPAITEPVVDRTLFDANGQAVLEVKFDPRGLSGLIAVDAPTESWMRGGSGDSRVWDYREWQWWRGHPWGDSCRPRYWTTAQFSPGEKRLDIRYQIDGFDCVQAFLLPEVVDNSHPHWDLVTSICNVSGGDVEEYGQFFACYTNFNEPNSCWFWEAGNRLTRFSEHGVKHLEGYVSHPDAYFAEREAIPHLPRGGGKIVSHWYRPVLVSHPSPAGWRSVILIEAQYAAGLAQGIRGAAMDYILFPGPVKQTFENNAVFAVHIRHHLIKSPALPTTEVLQQLWAQFEDSHEAIHALARAE